MATALTPSQLRVALNGGVAAMLATSEVMGKGVELMVAGGHPLWALAGTWFVKILLVGAGVLGGWANFDKPGSIRPPPMMPLVVTHEDLRKP